MILPPVVLVVWNQPSTENEFGATWLNGCVMIAVAVPLKVLAVLVSPLIAPGVPRVTPAPTMPSEKPAQS